MSNTVRQAIRYLAIAGIAMLSHLGAIQAATGLTPDALNALSPDQMRAHVLARVAEQQRTAAARAAEGLDTTPPVLTKFSVPAQVRAGEAIGVRYVASDDRSGVAYLYAYIAAVKNPLRFGFAQDLRTYPAQTVHGVAGMRGDPYAPSDTYTVQGVYLTDAAGNYRAYVGSELQALGNTAVTVHNPLGDDNSAPTLVKGRVLTPVVSLSAMQDGTGKPMWAGVEMDVADDDEGVTGPALAYTTFCKTDGVTCLNFSASVSNPRRRKATIMMGKQLGPADASTGEYKLRSVRIYDWAQNERFLQSKEFGGSTDFSPYFPSTTLTVVP